MRKIFFLIFLWVMCIFSTPIFAQQKLTLSLDEAIQLAMRENPNVQSQSLNHVLQKFNTWVQHWEFYPHYSITATAGVARRWHDDDEQWHNMPTVGLQPGISFLTPIGTQIKLNASNAGNDHHFRPTLSLQIVQPLMRGFGRPIVEAALNNAIDSETISCLNMENMLRSTVTNIINAYLGVVMAERTIQIDQDALDRAKRSVAQTKLFIKAGHKAGNELITVEANVASAQSVLENDKNQLLETRYALLAAIGLDPNTPVSFTNLNLETLIKKYHLPSLEETKQLVLKNDIQYQTDQITLHGSAQRTLLTAIDNTRWQLNFSINGTTGGTIDDEYHGFNSLFNRATQDYYVGVELNIPIDDQLAKQQVLSAKIALQQAELGLKKEKWEKETSAINGWNVVGSALRALHFAESAAQLQNKTYHVSYQKYLHGLIDSLELQSAQVQLIQAEQTLLNARINYLKALVNLDSLIGQTLQTWHVTVRAT